MAVDDRGEIVVEQDQGRGLARDVGAAPAHGDADVRRLQRGRVVDAVAGHGDDLAIGLQRIDDPQFLLGHDAREDGHDLHALRQLGIAHALELAAGHDVLGLELGLRGDRARRCRVVAGDHDDPDAGRAAFPAPPRARSGAADRQGRPGRGTRRQKRAASSGKRGRASRRARDAEHAHALLRHRVDRAAFTARVLRGRWHRARNGLGRALGGDEKIVIAVRPPRPG